ncbi:MAG: CHAT domain-containing protein [Microscillaceae bacterium]|nr:CHAT domain-containing protein [Microscillaceae bacterium]
MLEKISAQRLKNLKASIEEIENFIREYEKCQSLLDEVDRGQLQERICSLQKLQKGYEEEYNKLMKNPTNISELRNLLNEAFNDEELNAFCQDYFYEVYNNFANGQSKNDKITKLLDHCKRHIKYKYLLEKIEKVRPELYSQYESKLFKDDSNSSNPNNNPKTDTSTGAKPPGSNTEPGTAPLNTQPIIYLSFANDKDGHLKYLKQESDEIEKIFRALDDKNTVKLKRQDQSTVDNIFETFTHYRNQIVIFHYGGHANSSQLILKDQRAGAKSIAQLISKQTNLKLVFLNGCATKNQVREFFQLGVKTLIATSVPVEDQKATEFAIQFYQALANGYTIQEAFKISTSKLAAKNLIQAGSVIIHRFSDPIPELNIVDEKPWGLYTLNDTNLDWKIIEKNGETPPPPSEPESETKTEPEVEPKQPFNQEWKKEMKILFNGISNDKEEKVFFKKIIKELTDDEKLEEIRSLEANLSALRKEYNNSDITREQYKADRKKVQKLIFSFINEL